MKVYKEAGDARHGESSTLHTEPHPQDPNTEPNLMWFGSAFAHRGVTWWQMKYRPGLTELSFIKILLFLFLWKVPVIGSGIICVTVCTCQTHKRVLARCSLLLFHLFGPAELLSAPQSSSAWSEETSWIKQTASHSPPRRCVTSAADSLFTQSHFERHILKA